MGIKIDIGPKLVAKFRNLLGNPGVTVGPCIPDIARMVISDKAIIDNPTISILSPVRCY